MGVQFRGQCLPDSSAALDLFIQTASPVVSGQNLFPPVPSAVFIDGFTVDWGTVTQTIMLQSCSDPVMTVSDSVQLAWLVVFAMCAAWCIKIIRELI
jgi:hypothetical protein